MILNNKPNIYPKALDLHIRFHSKYIPRKIDDYDYLELYHRYWIEEINTICKLVKIEEYFKVPYYFLESKDTSQLYTYPVLSTNVYELVTNQEDFLSTDIVNNGISYKGYEIKFWFYKNWNKKYREFEKYLCLDSKNNINDNEYYTVESVLIHNQHKNCKMIKCF